MFPLEVDLAYTLGSLAAGAVKNLPVMHEIRDHWEGPLEKGMAAHSSVLAWRIRGHRRLKACSPLVAEPGTTA